MKAPNKECFNKFIYYGLMISLIDFLFILLPFSVNRNFFFKPKATYNH